MASSPTRPNDHAATARAGRSRVRHGYSPLVEIGAGWVRRPAPASLGPERAVARALRVTGTVSASASSTGRPRRGRCCKTDGQDKRVIAARRPRSIGQVRDRFRRSRHQLIDRGSLTTLTHKRPCRTCGSAPTCGAATRHRSPLARWGGTDAESHSRFPTLSVRYQSLRPRSVPARLSMS